MRKEEFSEMIGDINENYVKEAHMIRAKKKPSWVKWGAVAACLVLLAGVGDWRIGTLQPQEETLAGGIMPGGAFVGDDSDAGDFEKQEAANVDLGSDLDGDQAGYSTSMDQAKDEAADYSGDYSQAYTMPAITADAPMVEEAGSTGALTAYEAIWGGSYMDESGHWVVWLTENTPENQEKVFELNPDLSESTTTFKTADYSFAYLTELMANISEGMADGKLPYVTSAALMEQTNRVEVTMTTDDADSVAKVLAFDKIGGAIEIRYASGAVTDEVQSMK